MNLFIDNKSGLPIYEQICTQIKSQITGGALKPHDPLPSIRNLAKDLKISVITTKRAYEVLEESGYLYTVQGKGCFVAPVNAELLREETLMQIEAHVQEIVRLAACCRLSRAELTDMLGVYMEE